MLGRNRDDRGNWGYISDRTLQGFTKGKMKGYNSGCVISNCEVRTGEFEV
jgi:hypothetical protein